MKETLMLLLTHLFVSNTVYAIMQKTANEIGKRKKEIILSNQNY